jgi:hypothetical protein
LASCFSFVDMTLLVYRASQWRLTASAESRRARPPQSEPTLSDPLLEVSPVDEIGGSRVDLLTAARDLREPGLFDFRAGEGAIQAGGEFLDDPLALCGIELQGICCAARATPLTWPRSWPSSRPAR